MKVFKFGGASIKNADAVKNMRQIISDHADNKLLVVVSAMGKSTNLLETIVKDNINGANTAIGIDILRDYHLEVCKNLFTPAHQIFDKLEQLILDLKNELNNNSSYDQLYDQMVSKGELISSTIIADYLSICGLPALWLDAREYIRTDNNFREGLVDWKLTEELIKHDIRKQAEKHILITQGFLGRARNGLTTTLGREGSDFTAAIFASCISAESVTIWKDVPGVLNADPKLIADAVLYNELPYKEAAEMTYYGATVIHPKTIKPLANNGIPLLVKSFDHPEKPGTIIHNCLLKENLPAAIIIKHDQCLVTFKVLDYTFINEDNLSLIFKKLSEIGIKINIMQNSAISFSVVVDNEITKLQKLMLSLRDFFEMRYNSGLQLITVKNYAPDQLIKYRENQKILLEQISRNNYRALIAP